MKIRGATALLWLGLHFAHLCSLSSGAMQRQLVVHNAQQFADAVRSLQEGEDLVIELPANSVINMSDPVVLGPVTPQVSSGSLTIKGVVPGVGQHMALLDLGWRSQIAVSQLAH